MRGAEVRPKLFRQVERGNSKVVDLGRCSHRLQANRILPQLFIALKDEQPQCTECPSHGFWR